MWLSIFVALLAMAGCEAKPASPVATGGLPDDEILLVYSADRSLMLEPTKDGLRVRFQDSAVECGISPEVLQSWRVVQELAANRAPLRRKELTIDPNLEFSGVIVGLSTKLDTGEFEVRQVEGSADMRSASEAINEILLQCGIQGPLRLTIISESQE